MQFIASRTQLAHFEPRMTQKGGVQNFLTQHLKGRKKLERNVWVWDDNIKMVLKEANFGFILILLLHRSAKKKRNF
jgi:hypothetical protein